MDKFSSPNVIAPPESVIEPSAKVKFPIAAPVPVTLVNVPAAGVVPPMILLSIGEPSIIPPETVRSSAT